MGYLFFIFGGICYAFSYTYIKLEMEERKLWKKYGSDRPEIKICKKENVINVTTINAKPNDIFIASSTSRLGSRGGKPMIQMLPPI